MAGAGYKLFNTGDVLTAAQVNTYLQEQTVMVFANSTARTTALSGVLAEGMVSYLQDTNAVEVYNGSAWVGVSGAGDVTEVQAGTGISVASGTGPIPVVTNTMATAINAAGDLIYGTANDTFTRLGIGTAGQVLKVNSGATAPEWGAAGGASGLVFITSNTFSGSSGVNINNCFTSTYDNYIIILGRATSSAGANVQMRLRVSGADATGGDYVRQLLNASGTSLAGQRNTAQTEWSQIATAPATTENSFMFFKIFNPNRAVATYATSEHNDGETGSGLVLAHRTYTHTLATAYDGFTIFPSSGTFSGTVRVYGLANS